jgi:hypothetical protein
MGVEKTYLLPGLDLGIGVDIWSTVVCPGLRVDYGGLSYQKRSREGRTLGVIVTTKLSVNVVLCRSGAGERGKNDAMGQGQSTDLERGEENRRIGGGRHLSVLELNNV